MQGPGGRLTFGAWKFRRGRREQLLELLRFALGSLGIVEVFVGVSLMTGDAFLWSAHAEENMGLSISTQRACAAFLSNIALEVQPPAKKNGHQFRGNRYHSHPRAAQSR